MKLNLFLFWEGVSKETIKLNEYGNVITDDEKFDPETQRCLGISNDSFKKLSKAIR